ncbi:MAG: hypothetical protein WBM40_03770 [Thiohalocapsa sp.]
MAAVIERVDRLEDVVKDFVTSVGIEFNKLYNSQMRTEAELRAFKDEMTAFKDEMAAFKDEMADFKNELRAENREMNRKWGDLANKLGTIVEDLAAPSLPRIIHEIVAETVMDLMVRRKRRLSDGCVQEFDAIAITQTSIFLNSTKSTLRSTDVDQFVEEIGTFRVFFPEYDALPIVGVLASLSVDKSVLNYAEKRGFLVLAVGDQLMDVQNSPDFEPKRWIV